MSVIGKMRPVEAIPEMGGRIKENAEGGNSSIVNGIIVLVITSVLASCRRIKQDTKITVKVVVKFIRKVIHFQQTENGLSLE
jgi:hypothetical protein